MTRQGGGSQMGAGFLVPLPGRVKREAVAEIFNVLADRFR